LEENMPFGVARYCPPGSSLSPAKTEGVAPGYSDTGLQPEQTFPIPSNSYNVLVL